jgi:hypothetical protein
VLRHIIVDDVAHVGDVQPARGDVGGDEHLEAALPKALQGLLALALSACRGRFPLLTLKVPELRYLAFSHGLACCLWH